jgi:hypothetical protein
VWRGCGGGNTQAKKCYGHDEPAWWVEGGEREGRRREGGAPRGEAGREAGTEHGWGRYTTAGCRPGGTSCSMQQKPADRVWGWVEGEQQRCTDG